MRDSRTIPPRMVRNTPRWVLPTVVGLFLVAGGAVASWGLNLPLYAFSAGPVGDAVGAIEVQDTETFQPDGELILLTVALQQVNAYEALAAAFDPGVDLVSEEAIRPADQSDEDFKREGLSDMDESKRTAINVALAELGYETELLGDGVEVVSVLDGTDASRFLEKGDVITSIEGKPVQIVDDISTLLEGRSVGDQVGLGLQRGTTDLDVQLQLFAAPDQETRPIIGIEAATKNIRSITPFPIDIDTANLGGPSAGLMYTLAIIDLLSPGDLTRGHVVAGTGTISADRAVGAIGGIRQKVVAASGAGAEYMFVPADNYERALTVEVNGLELVSVSNLDEALTFLERLAAT